MLQAGLILAGYDSREGGQVYGLPLGGTLVKVPFAIGECSRARLMNGLPGICLLRIAYSQPFLHMHGARIHSACRQTVDGVVC
jgi:hypothetical protein